MHIHTLDPLGDLPPAQRIASSSSHSTAPVISNKVIRGKAVVVMVSVAMAAAVLITAVGRAHVAASTHPWTVRYTLS